MSVLNDFINIINSKVGAGYIWGGQSDAPLTKDKLQKLVDIFGREHYYFTNYSAEKWIGKEYYDCSGLIVHTSKRLQLIAENSDYTAEGIYRRLCKPANKSDLKAGDLCFVSKNNQISHVGVYMGGDRVVHARGTFYGVVNTSLFDSFNLFGKLLFFINKSLPIAIKKINSKKIVTTGVLNLRELPSTESKIVGQLKNGEIVDVSGVTEQNWFTMSYKGKTVYVYGTYLKDYDELKVALELLASKSGIDSSHWYKKAKEVEWLDKCFIKIAKAIK